VNDDFVLKMLRSALDDGLVTGDQIEHLLAEAETSAAATSVQDAVEDYLATVPEGTRRTYRTHLNRLVHGAPPLCECLCDQCLDVTSGCACDCRSCATKLDIPALGETIVSKTTFARADVTRWATYAQWHGRKDGVARNKGRRARGLKPLRRDGNGAKENAIAAYRALFTHLDTGDNPAQKVRKRLFTTERGGSPVTATP
jgi:hypothetical protein